MESRIKRLMSGRPHIWFFGGTWRASQALMMDSNGQSAALMEVFGGSPVEAGAELQRAILWASELKLGV